MRPLYCSVALILIGGCAGNAPSKLDTPQPIPPRAHAATPTVQPQPSAGLAISSAVPQLAPSPAPNASQPLTPQSMVQELPCSVRSLALGLKNHRAVLCDEPWLFDGTRWQRYALPANAQLGIQDQAHVYFGRDNRVRLMGSRSVEGNSWHPIYLRLKNERWQPEPSEIGRLGKRPYAGLYGWLAAEGPELVCKPGDACVIKQTTGWTTIPTDQRLRDIWIHDQRFWSLNGTTVERLDAGGWVAQGLGGTWAHATSMWSDGQTIWVTDDSADTIHVRQDGPWSVVKSPVKSPSVVAGRSTQELWVGGVDGAALWDGASWRKVNDFPHAVSRIAINEREVWLAGLAGLWRLTR